MNKRIKKYFMIFISGTKKMFKEFFKKETNKKQRANMWTFSRLIIPIFTVVFSIIGIKLKSKLFLILSGVSAGFGASTDFFDGRSSRKHNSQSEYGRLLDQASDKLFATIICINLLFLNENYLLILIFEFLIAINNICYKVKYPYLKMESSKCGKIKQWPLYVSLAFGYFSKLNNITFIISNILIIITCIFQIITILNYISINNKEIKEKVIA